MASADLRISRSLSIFGALIVFCLMVLAVSPSVFARTGPGGTGGGGPEESDFAGTARDIYLALKGQHRAATFILEKHDLIEMYGEALDNTEVRCAVEPLLSNTLRELDKRAYFIAEDDTIYLDCGRYASVRSAGMAKFVLVFHEYMRKLKLEGSDYSYSSRIPMALNSVYSLPMNVDERTPLEITNTSSEDPNPKSPVSPQKALSLAKKVKAHLRIDGADEDVGDLVSWKCNTKTYSRDPQQTNTTCEFKFALPLEICYFGYTYVTMRNVSTSESLSSAADLPTLSKVWRAQ